MPSFEEEAFARAQQMHRHTQSNNAGPSASTKRQTPPRQPQSETVEEPKQEASHPKAEACEQANAFDNLFQDKERSLILFLIVLLMDENPEPTLLLALMYLLL